MNPKILKNPYFYSAKMAPQKVDNLLTFKGANPLTLWRPKCGQPSASPAYITTHAYIYIYITPMYLYEIKICTNVFLYMYKFIDISIYIYIFVDIYI